MKKITLAALLPELTFLAMRSGGPGGQHANKVSTKVAVRWNVRNTTLLTAEEKLRLEKRLTATGELVITSQETRSQSTNKARAVAQLLALIAKTRAVKKHRTATKPTPAAVRTRLQSKRIQSNKKQSRGRNFGSAED